MTRPGRLFMDVSYTRTQQFNVGITRTVRRLVEELRRAPSLDGRSFATVSFNSYGFRMSDKGELPQVEVRHDKPAARVFRWITGASFRRLVLAALSLFPWALLRYIWATTSAWTFNFLTRAESAVMFRSGDVLLLCDASWNYPVWIAARKARAQGATVVLLMYDLIPLRHPQFCFALVPPIFRLWLENMLTTAHAVVCISAATEQDLRCFSRETGTPLPATGHFRLGSDPVRALRAGVVRDLLERFFSGGCAVFAAIGSFEPKKNYGFLLEVFERLWARGLGVRLLIIGRESAESLELIRSLRRHPEQGARLLTLFDATDSEVNFTYSNCRALVFPSSAEGFGLPLVEARTRGAMVIASSLPVFLELADRGVSIYAEGSHAALEALILARAQETSASIPPPMPPFTWHDSAEQCLRLVDSLMTQEQMS